MSCTRVVKIECTRIFKMKGTWIDKMKNTCIIKMKYFSWWHIKCHKIEIKMKVAWTMKIKVMNYEPKAHNSGLLIS